MHVCDSKTCPEPGKYYVTAVDGQLFWKMAGPYSSHSEALANVERARKITSEKDRSGRSDFMGWGTARMSDDTSELGNLNKAGLI